MRKNKAEKPLDRRRKYYMILDCETATLPIANNYDENIKKKIAIAKPLIYDIGWQIIDRKGKVHRRRSFLISEIFSVPSIFNTAYYANKRPLYIEKLNLKQITLTSWTEATAILYEDMKAVESVGAYNSMFDFKKAIPFTEQYINNLYSPNFYKWEQRQNDICKKIADDNALQNSNGFDPKHFFFRGESYSLFDVWGLACKHILNNDEYRSMCTREKWNTASGKYYKTSAETCYRYFKGITDFEEAHTAIEDSEIESEIFAEIMLRTKNKFEMGIIYFPFRLLGRADE